MKKIFFSVLFVSLSGVASANCAWGNCTQAELQQEYRQNQLNLLNGINNSLQQIQQQQQQQQQQVTPLGQWSNTPLQIAPNPWGAPPTNRQSSNCYISSLGRMVCL
jgi:hypothetical protein